MTTVRFLRLLASLGGVTIGVQRLVENLQPGVTEIIVHVAHDDAEMRAATVDHPDFGAAWRQRDLDVVTSGWFARCSSSTPCG